MPDSRTSWNDQRLDDFYDEFVKVRDTVTELPRMQATLESVARDCTAARQNVHALRSDWAAQQLRDQQERAADRQERKRDRHWLIGIIVAVLAIVVPAILVLVGHL